MFIYIRFSLAGLLLAAVFATANNARAETYHNCAGFIDSIPATISTQGIWCLRKDLATSLTGVSAINIVTNNVTIDCNGFKIGNLTAGPTTLSTGIYAYGQLSAITVRNCNIRGFAIGIAIYGNDPGSGHIVEDNLLDHNTSQGIYLIGYSSIVRRNRVLNTGGRPGYDRGYGISAMGDVIDNVVDGISGAADVTDFSAYGIYAGSSGGSVQDGVVVRDNRVRNLIPKGAYGAQGIAVASTSAWIRDNSLVEPTMTTGQGAYCSTGGHLTNNVIVNYATGNSSCSDNGGNIFF